ncbi:MAG: hypothetical protein JRH16_09645 [Deltaproteobacteria bacterium]|nr:hypothetical protein [Deltaproteobacteria bacterium]
MRSIATLVCFGTWLLACVSSPEVPICRERLVDVPPPPDTCLQRADGRVYLQLVAGEFSDDLMSWRTGPGSAEVTLGFDAESRVASACLGPTVGQTVSRRAPPAVVALRELPRGPACLSNRRLVLAWESPVVTHEEIIEATLACQPASDRLRYAISSCRLTALCSAEEVQALESEREKVLSECVLRRLPLTVSIPSERTHVNFLPSAQRPPSKARALTALTACAAPADETVLVACMQALGWEPMR